VVKNGIVSDFQTWVCIPQSLCQCTLAMGNSYLGEFTLYGPRRLARTLVVHFPMRTSMGDSLSYREMVSGTMDVHRPLWKYRKNPKILLAWLTKEENGTNSLLPNAELTQLALKSRSSHIRLRNFLRMH
jgi:hypothetical protein